MKVILILQNSIKTLLSEFVSTSTLKGGFINLHIISIFQKAASIQTKYCQYIDIAVSDDNPRIKFNKRPISLQYNGWCVAMNKPSHQSQCCSELFNNTYTPKHWMVCGYE